MSKLNEYAIDYEKQFDDFDNGKMTVIPKRESIGDALTRTYEYNMSWFEDIKYAKEEEAELIKEVKAQFNADVEDGKIPDAEQAHELEKRIKRATKKIRWPSRDPKNLLLIGAPGIGKTHIIEDWCAQHDVGLVDKKGGEIKAGVIGGYPSIGKRMRPKKDSAGNIKGEEAVTFRATEFFDDLDDDTYDQNILFLDELNRSDVESEADILSLVLDHVSPDREETEHMGKRLYKRYLFTVAAINPPNSEIQDAVRDISQAMSDRFFVKYCASDKTEFKNYAQDALQKDADFLTRAASRHPEDKQLQARAKLRVAQNEVKQLILDYLCNPKNNDFQFFDPDKAKDTKDTKDAKGKSSMYAKGKSLTTINYRTLKTAILACNGTIGIPTSSSKTHDYPAGSFMAEFQSGCTQDPEKLEVVEKILLPLQENLELKLQMKQDPANVPIATLYKVWRNDFKRTN